jgi:hypothetical protein
MKDILDEKTSRNSSTKSNGMEFPKSAELKEVVVRVERDTNK